MAAGAQRTGGQGVRVRVTVSSTVIGLTHHRDITSRTQPANRMRVAGSERPKGLSLKLLQTGDQQASGEWQRQSHLSQVASSGNAGCSRLHKDDIKEQGGDGGHRQPGLRGSSHL